MKIKLAWKITFIFCLVILLILAVVALLAIRLQASDFAEAMQIDGGRRLVPRRKRDDVLDGFADIDLHVGGKQHPRRAQVPGLPGADERPHAIAYNPYWPFYLETFSFSLFHHETYFNLVGSVNQVNSSGRFPGLAESWYFTLL